MKRSHKKLLIFELILFIIFLLNSFVSNILSNYNLIIFLVLSLIVFKKFFGFEKDRHRYVKDIMYEIIIFLIVFFILFYVTGIKTGFAKTENYYTIYGLFNFILPLVLSIILREILRYMMLKKIEGSKLLQITTYLLFVFFEVTTIVFYSNFKSGYETFSFVALTLLPAVLNNIVFNYISYKVGYKPVILYSLVMGLYMYLLPIIPDPNEYIMSLIRIIIPLILLNKIYNLFQKEKDEDIETNYNKKTSWYLLLPIAIVAILVYFTSGYFRFFAVAIASDSMNPVINKGDVVVIDSKSDKSNLKEGDVIAYRYEDVIVVHRLIQILELNDGNYYYTKGDSNLSKDNYVITDDMILGVVNYKVPYIGLPTVWLNQL